MSFSLLFIQVVMHARYTLGLSISEEMHRNRSRERFLHNFIGGIEEVRCVVSLVAFGCRQNHIDNPASLKK